MSGNATAGTTRVRSRRCEQLHVLVVMGVSGSGKTTAGKRLSALLGWPFRDGDEFHPSANIEKMAHGIALDDTDRAPWLAAIAEWIDQCRTSGRGGIVSCSALKRAYREIIIGDRSDVRLVYLKGSRALIADRMSRRRGHFMPPSLLASQFETLEEPAADEHAIVVSIRLPPRRLAEQIAALAGLTPSRLVGPV
jgi:carbohydrate kinase (thermoresistant glucokinase family)